jgi:cytoskeleton protein RodZ
MCAGRLMSDKSVELDASGDQPQRAEIAASTELPGQALAKRRQEMKWSVEDVAHSLHLAPRQIQALEADNYSALPGIAVTRGFIRSYAKLLQIDPVPLLQVIASEAGAKAEDVSLRRPLPAKPFYANRSLSMGKSSRSWTRSIVAALILLPIALFIAWQADWLPSDWKAQVQALVPLQTASDTVGRPLAEGSQTARNADPKNISDTRGLTQDAVTVEAGKPVAQFESVGENSGNASKVQSPAASQQTALQENTSAQAVAVAGTAGSSDMLTIKLREDSWIEIRNSGNKLLLSRLAKAGESEALAVREPIKLIIGNAAGVDVQLRGVPVELNATAKNNVARLTVN